MSKPVTLKKTQPKPKLKLVDELPIKIQNIQALAEEEPCKDINKDIEKIDTELRRLTEEKKLLVKKCNDLKYISKVEQPNTLMALLKYIFYNRIAKYDGLINRFPDSKERMGGLYTKNYIFEALWKIIFLLKFDNLVNVKKYKRIYKGSLENERLGKDGNIFTEFEYLADAGGIEKVNSGSKSGICDFYFTLEENKQKNPKESLIDPNKIPWACEETLFTPEPNEAYMFTSKLYNKPKGIQDYDYQNIMVEAQEVYGDKKKWNIVALVRNAEELRRVIMGGGDKALKAYADSNLIFDEADLRNTYYPILYKWLYTKFTEEKNNIEDKKDWKRLLNNVEHVFKIADNLRFHQKYIVEYTNKVIEDNLREQNATGAAYNPGRFIWGAVARSGKSYMIGGLVAKRKPRIVILLLGAINETKSQFIGDLFQKYTDLQQYIVIDLQEDASALDKYNTNQHERFVIVISQESLRTKVFKDNCLSSQKNPSNACENFFIENCNKKTIDAKYCEEHEKKIKNDDVTYNSKYAKKNETMKKNMLKKKHKTTIKEKKGKPKKSTNYKTTSDPLIDSLPLIESLPLIDSLIISMDSIAKEVADADEEAQIVPYNDSQITFIKELLKEKEKIIFFDEIHQGSGIGEESLQEQTIRFFNAEPYPKPLLIMVTATYSKPLGKYGKKFDGQEAVLILWTYEMIMLMKTFILDYVTYDKSASSGDKSASSGDKSASSGDKSASSGDKSASSGDKSASSGDKSASLDANATYLIDPTDALFADKMDLLHNLTLELNETGVSCEAIAQTYEKNPELVYLLPTLKDTDIDIDVNAEKHINIRHHLKDILEIDKRTNQFKYANGVNKLLTYIKKNVYDNLLNKEYEFIANGEGQTHTQLWFLPTSMKNTSTQHAEENNSEDTSIIGPMTNQLAKAIINHPDFINFNVCVIHGKTSFDNSYADLVSETDLKNKELTPRTAFFKCIREKEVKNCIKQKEKISKRDGKSLIILTGQRLRLGISLPCADVAIHMDNINAYDIIYQSMFRVLTERPGKKQGFFVDMVLDRAIQFFYKYTNIQQKFTKSIGINDPTAIEYERERVRKNLLLFDVGSISKSLGFSSNMSPVNSYSHIAETFHIHSNEQFEKEKKAIFENKKDDDYEQPEKVAKPPVEIKEKTSSEIIRKNKEDVVKLLESLYNDAIYKTHLDTLMKNADKKFALASEIIDKAKDTETKKTKPFKKPVDLENQEEQAANKAPTDEEIAQEKKNAKLLKEQFKNIAEQIQNTFSLYILFNSNVTLVEIIKGNDVLSSDQLSKIRNCIDDDILYYCYLLISEHDINKITDEKIQEIIKNHKEIISFLVQHQESVKKPIETLFNNIKDEMKPLKEKLKVEADAFKNLSLTNAQAFCPAIYNTTHKHVLEIIRQYLTPKKTEQKLFGEVFTPIELVCEMLSTLPIKAWTNPYLKWLDPANGIGNFPIIVYFKLMVTLSGFKDDTLDLTKEDVRSKHIIEHMLYMTEINPINVALCIKLFQMIDANAIPNVTKGDFLTTFKDGKRIKIKKVKKNDTVETHDLEKFDIIMGNPPFQEVTTEGLSKHGSGKLYPDFIEYAIQLLVDDGYLLFITPNTWFTGVSKTGKILDLFKRYNLLKLNNNNISKAFPKVGTGNLVFFLLQKNNTYETTELINTSTYMFSIKDKPFLPNILNRFSISICEKTLFNKVYTKFELIKDSRPYHVKYGATDEKTYTTRSDDTEWVTEIEDDSHLYPIFHSSNIELYSSKANFFQKYKKLLLSNSGAIDPLYDNGQLGFSQNSSAIIVDSKAEGDRIIKLFKSKLYAYLEKCVRYSMAISIHYLSFFPYPMDIKENFTDTDVYTYFGLTMEEIAEIEKTV